MPNIPMVRTRFAPSPTGLLHLGHAYAAQIARDLAISQAGEFLLRFEDIDSTRIRQEYFNHIEEDLAWLGLIWNGPPLRQTDRLPAYEAALLTLRKLGVVYPCFCTRRSIDEELSRMRGAPQGPEGPQYPGTCRMLSETERDEKIAAGRSLSWRLEAKQAAVLSGPLQFTDHHRGHIAVDPAQLGDVILARKDIGTSYHLAVVVDDAFQAISHVTRGEDLLAATHVHRLLQCLLNLPEPQYFHHRLLLDAEGRRLAKRHDALSIRTLRETGHSPESVLRSFAP
jgi:glutamyl-Q tRNA(Asp) synthetase